MFRIIRNLSFSRVAIGVVLSASVFAFLGVFSSVSADEADDVGGPDVTVQATETRSPEEQLSWVREQSRTARTIVDRTQRMLEEARSDNDTLKLSCLDDKLTQLHVTLQGIEERTKSLEVSIQAGDSVSGSQNFAILKIYVSRIFKLNAESENCLGESDVVLGKTTTTVSVDGDIAEYNPDDPAEGIPLNVGVAQPNELSGFY